MNGCDVNADVTSSEWTPLVNAAFRCSVVKLLCRNANKFNLKTQKKLVSALIPTLIMVALHGTVVLVKGQIPNYKWHKKKKNCHDVCMLCV